MNLFEKNNDNFDSKKFFILGELGPAAIAGITIGAVSVLMALMVTIYFCYYTANHVSDDYPPPHQVHVPQNYPHTAYQKAPNHPK